MESELKFVCSKMLFDILENSDKNEYERIFELFPESFLNLLFNYEALNKKILYLFLTKCKQADRSRLLGLQDEYKNEYIRLLKEFEEKDFEFGEDELVWTDTSFSEMINKYRKLVKLSVVDLYTNIGCSSATWSRFLYDRKGSGGKNDREYLRRLCFVLHLQPLEAEVMIATSGNIGFDRRERRDYAICKCLQAKIYDTDKVDDYLKSQNVEPLFNFCEWKGESQN